MKHYLDYLEQNATIQSLVRSHSIKTPNKLALIDGNLKITYQELDSMSDIIALNILKDNEISNDTIIGIYYNKSYKYILAALSILKMGAKILHLDEDYPSHTLEYIIKKTAPLTIFTCSELIYKLPKDCPYNTLDEKLNNLKGCTKKVKIFSNHKETAIIGYTSGTTGRPKGVEVSHKACIFSFNKFWEETDHIKNKNNFGYVTYLAWDAFSPLVNGSTGIIIPTAANTDMELLSSKLIFHEIDNAFFTPSLLNKLLHSLPMNQLKNTFEKINVIWVGGEIIKKSTIQNLHQVKSSIHLINNYGPTECFVVSQGLLDYHLVKNDKIVNAGLILPELDYKLFDDQNNDFTSKGMGYLFITGPALANQYFANEELTAKKFVKIENVTYYETGDYCLVDENRRITILGRNSFILKDQNGNSTPASLIENAILDNINIDNCVVITKNENQVLVYILSAQKYSKNDVSKIIKQFSDNFKIIDIDEIPIKPASQKINYEELFKLV